MFQTFKRAAFLLIFIGFYRFFTDFYRFLSTLEVQDDSPGHLGYTSAATSAGEARLDGLGAMLGHLDPPTLSQNIYAYSRKREVFDGLGAVLFRFRPIHFRIRERKRSEKEKIPGT